jgi:hypothetical protein
LFPETLKISSRSKEPNTSTSLWYNPPWKTLSWGKKKLSLLERKQRRNVILCASGKTALLGKFLFFSGVI